MKPENTEMVIVPLPYSSRVDSRGDVRMSSHTALVTDAAVSLAKENPTAKVFIPGENTFGLDFPSTADLMRLQMMRKGINEERIETIGNVNNTEEQLEAVNTHGIVNPHIVALDFHIDRATTLSTQIGITPEIHQAEELILKYHSGATKERIEKIVATRIKLLGQSKMYLYEGIARTAVKLGSPGKFALKTVRALAGAEGPAVTDYHNVDAAKNFTPRKDI